MTISRAQMNRQLYQMGGIGTLPMDFGQPLQVSQPMMNPSFGPMQPMMNNPMANYGQTPLTMMGGGITRLGYQEGGMDQMMMEPQMQEQMMQPQMQEQMMQAPMQDQMMPAAGGEEQGLSEEKGTMSLAVIIKLLMDQGIDPETAKQLAMQILQVFAQGGEPAVEAFANQLEQQEMSQERTMMAGGGITSINEARNMLQSRAPSGEFLAYINPQEASVLRRMGGLGKDINNTGVPSFILKSIGKSIKKIFKSDIGKIALTVAAVYFGGPMLATSFGVSAATGAAIAGGLANSALQLASGKKFNPMEALLSAGGAYVGAGGLSGAPTTSVPGVEELLKSGVATPSEVFTLPGTLSSGVTGAKASPINYFSPTEYAGVSQPFSPMESQFAGSGQYSAPATSVMQQPNLVDKGIMSARQAGEYLSETGTNFMQDPIATLGRGFTNVKEFSKDKPYETLALTTYGLNALSQQPGESDDEYSARAERDPQVKAYITQYGGGIGLRSPSFYSMEKAVDPFAGTSLTTSTNPFYPQGYSMGGRIGYEGGSMPMGEPRRNPAGIMELDYRAKGGFVPPVGIKEKADDIPAMLSNNEFVFTADAVRAAGGGSVNKGAQKMYGLMKQLESGIA